MSIKNNIAGIQGSELFSVQVYPKDYFREFSQEREFTKWATVRVDAPVIPENGLRTLIIPDGLYAIFHYRGLSSDPSIFQYIFSEWLPFSGYSLADRPHFEVLGKNYRNNDPGSEEDIYIPVDPIQ